MQWLGREQLEEELMKVKGEMERLEEALREVVEAEQHQAVDNLEEYFFAFESRFTTLRKVFFDLLKTREMS